MGKEETPVRMKRASQSASKLGLLIGLLVLVLGITTSVYMKWSTQTAVASSEPVSYTPQPKVPILMYHSIAAGNDLKVPLEDFDAQMKWLSENGFKPITLGQLNRYWQGNYPVEGKPVVITFDDGYLDNYTAAFPVLQKFHFPATIFVITDSVKRDNHMKWEQMREMHKDGIEFGSHMAHHSNFTKTPIDQIKAELKESKQELEQELGSPVTTFCYPGGGLIPEASQLVREAGYTMAVTTKNTFASQDEDQELLSRVRIVGGVSIDQFAHLLQGL